MTHWKKLTNPDYLGAYALEDGQDITLTIRSVGEEVVTGTDGKKENCVVAHFVEKVKPMILNATNMKMLTKLYKSPYIEDWVGKKFIVGATKIKAFGEIVEALRIRDKLPQEKAIHCEECSGKLKPFGKMSVDELASYTKKKYGKVLCSDCATKAAKAEQENNNATETE